MEIMLCTTMGMGWEWELHGHKLGGNVIEKVIPSHLYF